MSTLSPSSNHFSFPDRASLGVATKGVISKGVISKVGEVETSGNKEFAAALDEVAAPPALKLKLSNRTEPETRAAIHKSAIEFETATMGQMLSFMTQEVGVDPNFGGGHAEEMFRGMLNSEYGKLSMAKGGTGVASQVEREMLRAQGLKPLDTRV